MQGWLLEREKRRREIGRGREGEGGEGEGEGEGEYIITIGRTTLDTLIRSMFWDNLL